MGIVVYSLLWVMQDLYHQPYQELLPQLGIQFPGLGFPQIVISSTRDLSHFSSLTKELSLTMVSPGSHVSFSMLTRSRPCNQQNN